MTDLPFPRSLPEFQRLFPNDQACSDYLERIRWNKVFVCPKCAQAGEPFRFEARPGVLRCRKCRKDTSLTAGTVMERTHTPLSTWFWGAYLVSTLTSGSTFGLTKGQLAGMTHRLKRQLEDRVLLSND